MAGLRVAYVVGSSEGGISRHVAMLAHGCARAGLEVSVLGPSQMRSLLGTDLRDAGADGTAIVHRSLTIGDRPRPVRDAQTVWKLRRLLSGIGPAVVHAHGLRAGAVAALAMRPLPGGRRFGGRARSPALVVTVHNAPPAGVAQAAVYRLLERLVARSADAVMCVSDDLTARMRSLGARDAGRAVVPAAAAVSGHVADEELLSLRSAGRPLVLAVGRLSAQKGFDLLLEAAARWRTRRPEPIVLLAGSGPLAGELAGLARELGVAVQFLGQRDDVPALLTAADVVVLPSRWEGQPLVLQEALAAGRPVVATEVGGVRDLAGDAALLVPPGDPDELALSVLRVLDDPELSRALAAAASARAAALPGEPEAVAAVLDVYTRVTDIKLIGMIRVRRGRPEDAETVAAVRAASWRAAYDGVIPAAILRRLTSPSIVTARAAAMRERWPDGVLIAEAEADVAAVGFANFGRERVPNGVPLAPPADQDTRRAELYAIYVLPEYWSTGAGLALLREVLERAALKGFETISLWVLEENRRARRFYERAGFGLTDHSAVLESLGGVTEIRYEMPLA